MKEAELLLLKMYPFSLIHLLTNKIWTSLCIHAIQWELIFQVSIFQFLSFHSWYLQTAKAQSLWPACTKSAGWSELLLFALCFNHFAWCCKFFTMWQFLMTAGDVLHYLHCGWGLKCNDGFECCPLIRNADRDFPWGYSAASSSAMTGWSDVPWIKSWRGG